MTEPAHQWRAGLRSRLIAARKAKDNVAVAALRSALSAIDNAETPDVPLPRAGAIADSAHGLGAAEVARRRLTEDQIRELIDAEADERRAAAGQLRSAGRDDRAAQVEAEAAVLRALLGSD
ncbi:MULTISPECIES: GatB/YqeY domain-containing protein [Mycolicibacterium]|uniref:GatB/YqeY domain-containing protein n=1 Tax=Mycolicibacterium TaxID=1866885 RepID=UPI000FB5E804|nr:MULTISPECIES: GatB/YqeY domain-containing protein [Mycolicibacterium]RUP28944.1 MAG: GatB/YqeY [Mycolicibacterium sp.]UCZ58581.1 GatB/YqeY domain-containing protein [Mycolicibacterium phocaicum]